MTVPAQPQTQLSAAAPALPDSPAAPPASPAAPAAPPASPAAPASPPASLDEVIAANRARIDELDGRIIALVQERMAVSRAVQEARIGSGGRRVHLARELEILRAYGDALGRPGTSVAMTLLELCRGSV